MSNLLDTILGPNDIKKLSSNEYGLLAEEIRRFLIRNISKTGGHLASNLGVVELTMALHLTLNLPTDKIIWDVGHQAYTHKILTGRKEEFTTLRQFGGLSGFPKMCESECDCFDTGHSSTSISAAMGFVQARELLGLDNKVVAVIGDGALSGGMAYEALNNAGRLKSNLIIVLNDNNMSISENVGGMANYLGKLRTGSKYNDLKDDVQTTLSKIPVIGSPMIDKIKKSKDSIKRLMIQGMLFEDMGLTYIGPIDGHNIRELITAFQSAKQAKKAVLVHVLTKKGKGYKQAENNPSKFHGVEPFNLKTGTAMSKSKGVSYTDVFGKTLVELGKADPRIVAITAAMPDGTGLCNFAKEYPKRFFDVGIAEEHAVTFAAGLAAAGFKPVVAVYSTFLQRAYDQIIHDVCINRLPVTFAIDRAGIVGKDGETHQGVFDISYLSSIPNLTVLSPKNKYELAQMLKYAMAYEGPVAIRYPRGSAYEGLQEYAAPIEYGKSEVIQEEDTTLLLGVGHMVETAVEVSKILKEHGINSSVVNARFIKPMDTNLLKTMLTNHSTIVTLEENVALGGFGSQVSSFLMEHGFHNVNHINVSLPDQYIEHGDANILRLKYGLDPESIGKRILNSIDTSNR